MKRQRGRGRKPGNHNNHNHNRSFESNWPDVKIRGNAQTVYDKYLQLARDATSSGDRIMAENYHQHAEHYFRLIQANQQRRDEQQQQHNQRNDQDSQDGQDGQNTFDNQSDNRSRGRGRGRPRDDQSNDQPTDRSQQEQPGVEASEDKPKRGRRPRVKAEDGPSDDPMAVVDPSGDNDEKKPRRRRTTKAGSDKAAQDALDKAEAKSGEDTAAA